MENLVNALKTNRAFAFASALVLLLILLALAAPLIAPYDPLTALEASTSGATVSDQR